MAIKEDLTRLLGLLLKVTFVCILILSGESNSEKVIQTFTGTLGPGNYSYFSLHEKGEISLIVDSLVGDADLYVSQTVSKPTYADYDLQSTTCGRDIVTVPATFKRPVGIALFGHVHSQITKYRLTAVLDYSGESETMLGFEESFFSTFSGSDDHGEDSEHGENSLKSVLWTILVGFLKLVIEIIT